jgi:hypothetical protein
MAAAHIACEAESGSQSADETVLPAISITCGSSDVPTAEMQAAADYARGEKAAATKRAHAALCAPSAK